jgi:hypothetical protein
MSGRLLVPKALYQMKSHQTTTSTLLTWTRLMSEHCSDYDLLSIISRCIDDYCTTDH